MPRAAEEELVVSVESIKSILKPALAEFVGCFFFIYIAVGAAVTTIANYQNPGPLTTAIALVFGWTIFVLAFTFGHVSGGHLNPAVTLGFMVTQKTSLKRGFIYIIAQVLGAIAGCGLMASSVPADYHHISCFASNQLAVSIDAVTGEKTQIVSAGQGFLLEFILTFFLLLVIGSAVDSTKSNRTLVPLAIGTAVTICHFVAIPLTGMGLNPARSFASALVSTHYGSDCAHIWDDHWIFWLGPLLGGVAGEIFYEFVFSEGIRGITLEAMYRNVKLPALPALPSVGRARTTTSPTTLEPREQKAQE